MTVVNVYLTFDGNCKQAFDFYKDVFQKAFSDVNTYGEMPASADMPPVSEDEKDKIMHIALPIGGETVIMGCDTAGWSEAPFVQGNNFSISVNPSDKAEADRLFNALSEGGKVTMPFEKTFWNAYFGMLKDKFGINWMVNLNL